MRHREILEACWKGYHKEGMKTMFGKRYPNCVKNKKKSNEDINQAVSEGALNEFDPGEGGFGPFKLYKGDRFNLTHIDTFSSLDDAEEELRFQIDLAAQEGSVDYYKIIDGTGEEVGGFDPDEAFDNMRRGSRVQYRKPDDQGIAEGHGRYYCSTDKKWKERKGPKQTRQSESVDQYEYDLSLLTESELEEDLKKWFKQKWVRFGPDGKIRGECGGRDDSEGKPKCLPASKAHALGKKGRSSSAAKKRREDPNPERRGPAKNVATKTRTMK
jgi:hypothetical protein